MPRNQLAGPRVAPWLGDPVAGDVFGYESVVRQVCVERADDVIAIAMRLGDLEVEFVALRLGEADEVEPVPAPAFAVSGRGEQAIDDALAGGRRLVGQERADLRNGRRQPGEPERHPPQPSSPVAALVGVDAGRLLLSEDEAIDRRRRPIGRVDGRRPDVSANRPEGPVVSRVVGATTGGEDKNAQARDPRRAQSEVGKHHKLAAGKLSGVSPS